MIHPRILIIASAPQTANELSLILADASLQDTAFTLSNVADAAKHLRELSTSHASPVLVVIAPDIAKPVALAVELRPLCMLCHFLFLCHADQTDRIRQGLTWATVLGTHWSLARAGDPALPQLLRDTLKSVQRRARLRTTLDRVNLQLSNQRSIDSLE